MFLFMKFRYILFGVFVLFISVVSYFIIKQIYFGIMSYGIKVEGNLLFFEVGVGLNWKLRKVEV